MCVGGTPNVPSVPERQSVKQPSADARGLSQDDEMRRRRGMMATILTSSQGALTPVSTTAGAAAPKTQLG
jgi:hypothetical protein